MHRVSVPHEFASRSRASHRAEAEAVLRVDLEVQQAIRPQECYQVERHIASSTLRAGTGSQDGSFGRSGLRGRRGPQLPGTLVVRVA